MDGDDLLNSLHLHNTCFRIHCYVHAISMQCVTDTRFEALTSVLLEVQVFWGVKLCP
jgi:hypothetical protein